MRSRRPKPKACFALSGAARSVQDKQRIFRVHRLRRALNGNLDHQLMQPVVAPMGEVYVAARAIDHQALHAGVAFFQRLVRIALQRNRTAAAQALIGGDDQFSAAIIDPVSESVRRKATEHNRMHRADPCAGEHRISGFRDHRHIENDAIALGRPQAASEHSRRGARGRRAGDR